MYKTFSSSSLSERISDVTGEGLIGLKEWFCGKWRNGDEFDFLGGCGIDAGGGEAGVNRNCFGGPVSRRWTKIAYEYEFVLPIDCW